jgi:predicted ATPase
MEYASVELFVELTSPSEAPLELREIDVKDVAEICRVLDGLPLAIELAVERCRDLPPSTLIVRLADGLSALGVAHQDGPNADLVTSIGRSVDRLTLLERRVLASLAGLENDRTTQQIATQWPGPETAGDIAECITRLVDRSLVAVGSRRPEPRYRLLWPIRMYAAVMADEVDIVASVPPKVSARLAPQDPTRRANTPAPR